MVRPKAGSSKKPNRGVDFKKIKRKIGRKLPPARNFTNLQVKSKAIILPEQSVASERAGLAVNKKGLTLRELLQQTSHHNAKIRKAALNGIRDLVLKHPLELKLHKVAIIEKLRERICDNDKVVRETLYQLLKTLISPCSKEDTNGPIISLLMAYVFNAMTHMAVDIRLMAFKFFELIVRSYPSSFILYAEKVLDNYIDVLRNSQIYVNDKSKLKNVLDGLDYCLSLLECKKREIDPSCKPQKIDESRCLHAFETEVPRDDAGISSAVRKLYGLVPILVNCFRESSSLISAVPIIDAQSFDCMSCTLKCISLAVKVSYGNHMPCASSGPLLTTLSDEPTLRSTMLIHLKKLWESFPIGKMHSSSEKEDGKYLTLNVRMLEIFLHLTEWTDDSTIPFEKFFGFIESLLLGQVCSNFPSKVFLEKHCGPVMPFIPRLMSQIIGGWRTRLLEAFTGAFEDCDAASEICQAYLSAIEEMLLPMESETVLSIASNCPDMLEYQIAWIRGLPKILLHLGDKHSSMSKVVLKLLLRIGQCSLQNSPISLEYDDLQGPLKEFYVIKGVAGKIHYGPFIKLPRDCQELAICCLYYISNFSPDLLESLITCCLCDDMDPVMLLRVIDVLHSAYNAGHLQISDQIGMLVTLVARFKASPGKSCVMANDRKVSNQETHKSLTSSVCSCLSLMGDSSLVLKLLYKNIFNEMSLKPSLDNMYGLLRMMVTLGCRSTRLPEENVSVLSNQLFAYLIEAASYIPQQIDMAFQSDQIRTFRYYMQPCMFLFYGSDKLLFHVLKSLDSSVVRDNQLFLSHSGVEYAPDTFSRVRIVYSILIFMFNDERLHRNLSSCEAAINLILQNVLHLMDSSEWSMTLEEKHKTQTACDLLKSRACTLQFRSAKDLEKT